LGHLAVLTDIISIDAKSSQEESAFSGYIVTCDHEEKIRVSEYPSTYAIQSFCIGGHTSFVTCLREVIVSTESKQLSFLASGGDESVIYLWDYLTGTLLHSLSLAPTGENITDKGYITSIQFISLKGKSGKGYPLVAVSVSNRKEIVLLTLQSLNSTFQPSSFSLIKVATIPLPTIPITTTLQKSEEFSSRLWIAGEDQKRALLAYDLQINVENGQESVSGVEVDTLDLNQRLVIPVSSELNIPAICAKQKKEKLQRLERIKEAERKRQERRATQKKKTKRRKKE